MDSWYIALLLFIFAAVIAFVLRYITKSNHHWLKINLDSWTGRDSNSQSLDSESRVLTVRPNIQLNEFPFHAYLVVYGFINNYTFLNSESTHTPPDIPPAGSRFGTQYVLPAHLNVQPSFQCESFSPSQKQLLSCIQMRYVNVHFIQNLAPSYTNFLFGLTHPALLFLFH